MTAQDLSFVEISSIQDDLLVPWLELYETAFAASERILTATILAILKAKMQGEQQEICLLAVVDPLGDLIGMAMFSTHPDRKASFLWYMAVIRELRGKGLGTIIYHEVLRRVNALQAGMLVFEVEIPEDHNASEARRRIHFYQKQGALLMTGVHYMQDVGWHQPPIPMHVMIHPSEPITAQKAYLVAKSIFEDAIEQDGEPGLETK